MSTFARIDAVSSLVLDQETLPAELGPDQVQVDITSCGICATALGFTDVMAPGDAAQTWIDEVTSGLGADVLYECSGEAALLKSSSEMVCELTVIGSLAYTHDDFLGAMRAIADGSVQVEPLHTATIGLADLALMLDELDSGDTSQAKVPLDPRVVTTGVSTQPH